MAPICGIDAETIREVARLYATSKGSMILWGMGISQHVHGTDNARCLIALALSTGQIGKPGSGLHPLRGQNNVQGASDSGPDSDVLSGLPARRRRRSARQRFEKLWGTDARSEAGPDRGRDHERRARRQDPRHVHHGREPGDVRPGRRSRARGARDARSPGRAGHLPHRDGVPRRRGAAGDRVAGEDRHRHQHRSHGAARPQGDRRRRATREQDLWIINELARRMGLDWNYAHPRDVFNEMRQCMDSIAGITWERLERESSVTYPCEKEGDPGQPVVFVDDFPTADRPRASSCRPTSSPAAERPDARVSRWC